jgi:hypothetical protein
MSSPNNTAFYMLTGTGEVAAAPAGEPAFGFASLATEVRSC